MRGGRRRRGAAGCGGLHAVAHAGPPVRRAPAAGPTRWCPRPASSRPDLAVVVADDAVDDREARGRCPSRTAVERLEERRRAPRAECRRLRRCTVIDDAAGRGSSRAPISRSRPPSGIARSPLVARFQTICWIWPSSASYQSSRGRHVDVDRVPSPHFGAVAQQQRRVVEHAPHVEARDREALRPRVREKRSDGRVEPLGLAQHDVHQLLLLRAERQLLAQNLDRPGHRRERIPDFVRDAGRHLAHRREALLHARVALELLDVGDVLEREQQAGAPARRLAGAWRVRPISIAAAVRRRDSGARCAARAAATRSRVERRRHRGGSCSTSPIGRPTTARTACR